jgi:hypothetical protein
LPSFVIVPLPKTARSKENIKTTVNNFVVTKCKTSPKAGTVPGSFLETAEACFFYYAIEYEQEYETLEGFKKLEPLPIEKIPVVIFDNVVAVGHGKKEFEEKVLEFIEVNITPGFALQHVEFDERLLRGVIEKYPDVLQLDLTPISGRIDKISCIGRGITETDFWRDYGDQPLVHVKVRLSDLPEEANVGFRRNGILTIYNRNFSISQQIAALNAIISLILPCVRTAFQTKLRWEDDFQVD